MALKDFERARIAQTSQEVKSYSPAPVALCHACRIYYHTSNTCGVLGVYILQQWVLQVLFSRYVGELRQGRWIDPASFDWPGKPDSTKALLLNAKRSEPDYRASALAELKHHTNNLAANGHSISVQ